jgi:hypothetical protein
VPLLDSNTALAMQPKPITTACSMSPTGLRGLHAADLSLGNRPELGRHKVDSGTAQMIVVAIKRMTRRPEIL